MNLQGVCTRVSSARWRQTHVGMQGINKGVGHDTLQTDRICSKRGYSIVCAILPCSCAAVWAVHKPGAGIDRGIACLHGEVGLVLTNIQQCALDSRS